MGAFFVIIRGTAAAGEGWGLYLKWAYSQAGVLQVRGERPVVLDLLESSLPTLAPRGGALAACALGVCKHAVYVHGWQALPVARASGGVWFVCPSAAAFCQGAIRFCLGMTKNDDIQERKSSSTIPLQEPQKI